MNTPEIFVLSGPNGAGKSTTATVLVPESLGIQEFVNADLIAQGLSPFAPANGRAMPMYSIRIQKRYRDDRDGQWKTTSYLRPDELPKLALVVSRAYEFLTLRETEEASGVAAS